MRISDGDTACFPDLGSDTLGGSIVIGPAMTRTATQVIYHD
jgi:hypothetical protein